jgi:hypothetical protein
MKFFKTIMTCLVFALVCAPSCGKRHSAPIDKKPAPAQTHQLIPFVPPADSTISPTSMTAWFACNRGLDSLSKIFTGIVAAGNTTDSTRKKFSAAQDSVCVSNGLSGGYKEYQWILDNIGSKKNKSMYDSVKGICKK